MSKQKDDDELGFELRTSKDARLVILKITAPHELNSQDLIWALEYYLEQLKKAEEGRRLAGGLVS